MGNPYTWDNKRKYSYNIMEPLDRFLANGTWRIHFTDHQASNLDFLESNHMLILLNIKLHRTNVNHFPRRGKTFTFEHIWLMENEYEDILKQWWEATKGSPAINEKLTSLRDHLQNWASHSGGSIQKNIKKINEKLNYMLVNQGNTASPQDIDTLKNKLKKLSYKEEVYWHQRSRNNWLSAGDRNTTYFYKSASKRKNATLLMLSRMTGVRLSLPSVILRTWWSIIMNLFFQPPSLQARTYKE